MLGMKGSRIASVVLGLGVLVGLQTQPASAQITRKNSDGVGTVGRVSAKSSAELTALVNEELGLYSSTVVSLDIDPIVGTELRVLVPIAGTWHTMVLAPHTVRSPDYRLLVQGPDGSLSAVVPGPERTLRGGIVGIEGSIVAASMLDDGLHAMIAMSPDAERVWLEPIAERILGAGVNDYVVYRDTDVIGTEGTCGTADKAAVDAHIAANGGIKAPDGFTAGGGGVCVAELGVDADTEYFAAHGSSVPSTEAQINAVINTVNVQYESQVGISHEITLLIVRTSEPDPYTTTDFGDLLCQFITEWTGFAVHNWDVAHLFTGEDLNGGVIGVAATFGDICDTNGGCSGPIFMDGAYCLSQSDFNGNFSCATDLTAHELGHVWGAFHCNCPTNTMNPNITCANNFTAGTIQSITARRDSVSCLSCSAATCGNGVIEPGEWWDMFDTYTNGQILDDDATDGGWKGWDNDPTWFGTVTNVQWWSAAQSVDINGNSDLVHEYCGATSGQWIYKAYQFIPSDFTGETWFILLNTYSDGGFKDWSVQVSFNSATGNMESDFDGAAMPFATGVWKEIRIEIDLDADVQSFFYDNILLYTKSWTEGVTGTGAMNINAVDLFAAGASVVYYDDMHLELAPCEPVAEDCANGVDDDCDGLIDCDDPDCLGAIPETCDDGDACTTGDTCAGNQCIGTPVACPPGEQCDPVDGLCKECVVAADCDDGVFCNGAETCVANACQPGTGLCTDATLPVCDETDDECVECLIDEECVGNENGPFCNVGPDVCVECLNDLDCDDGVFCNGAETCVANACQPGGDPCTDETLPVCDETDDACVECLIDEECDGNENGPFCNVGPDVCVECLADAECDDTNVCTTDTCTGNACVNTPVTNGTLCTDGAFCNGDETCQSGTCTDGTDPCDDLAHCDEKNGVCFECLADAECGDGNACTADACTSNACVSTDTTPVGLCCDPDSGGLTPIDDGDACTDDVCNADGTVDHPDNFDPGECCDSSSGNVTPIDDGNDCTVDQCNEDGSVTHTVLANAPIVEGVGPRTITVTPLPIGLDLPVALLLTSPSFPCLLKYVDVNGSLVDNPVEQPPAEWGIVTVTGTDIVPSTNMVNTVYQVQADCGGALTEAGAGVTFVWGDVDNNGTVDFDDVLFLLEGFAGNFVVPLEALDLFPCEPDGAIDFDDILVELEAFAGAQFPCAAPCDAGACCVAPAPLCLILLEQECVDQAGQFLGAGTVCVPNPCQ